MSFEFRQGEGAAEGARRIARDQIGKAVDRLEAGPPAEAVHDARRRIKKARAILRLARVVIGRKRAKKADRRLRDAARPLGEARDASALISTLEDLAGGPGGVVPPEAFVEARRALASRRDAIHRRVLDQGEATARTASALRGLLRRLGRWDLADDTDPASGLRRTYRRGRATFDAVAEGPTPEAFHEWRKRVKDLGYQLRALGVGAEGPAPRLRRLAGLLAQELGELHDLDVLREALDGPALDAILPAIEHRRDDLRQVAVQRGQAVFRDKPGAFVRQVGGARRSSRSPANG